MKTLTLPGKLSLPLVLLLLALPGCARMLPESLRGGSGEEVAVTLDPATGALRPQARPDASATASRPRASAISPQGRSAAALDTTTEAERQAAARAAQSGRAQRLGETLASLGAPGEQGLWLATPLTDRIRAGRVTAASGASIALELRPSGGAAGSGSQISLAALRALSLPLTGLASLQVDALD